MPSEHTLDADRIKSAIRDYIRQELIRDSAFPLGDDDPLLSAGVVDSFGVVQIHIFVEKSFGIYIPDDQLKLENVDSLNKLAACILTFASAAGAK
jgi:acyl carrier protein